MAEGALSGDVREAVEDLQAYLSDQVAPLLVLDSVNVLLAHAPELGAEVVRVWVSGQLRNPTASATDYLFHAIKKIQLLGMLRLVESEPLQAYLDGVIDALVAQTPESDREALRAFMLTARETETSMAAQVQVLHRPLLPGAPPAGGAPGQPISEQVSGELAVSMRQFALLLARLGLDERKVGSGRPGDRGAAAGDIQIPIPIALEGRGIADQQRASLAEQAPQLLVVATQSARNQGELEQHLQSLSRAGLMTQVRLSELFTTLSQGLPNWSLGEAGSLESGPAQAMHRIVELAGDPAKATGHFRELLKTVAQQFNERALGRAVQVLDVIHRVLEEKKVDRGSADLMLATAHEDLDAGQLMAQTQQTSSLPLLRRLLNSYPALTPEGLLRTLDNEPDRARRRLWIALLEAHGIPARQAALIRLEQSFVEPTQSAHLYWLRRNFVYLLHRIKPAAGDDVLREVRLGARCADLKLPAPLVREALIDLGLRHHPEAETVLRQRLEELERLLEQGATVPHDPPELRRMVGLVISGLARHGTSSARRAVVAHGLSQKPALGDTLERLGELSTVDLAEDPEVVDRLLEALRAQLPVRVFGVQIRRHDGSTQLVHALAATRSPAVRQMFEEIARQFPGESFGKEAAAALAGWNVKPPPPVEVESTAQTAPAAASVAGLSGDLEVFGLPELLQTLSQAESSGRLVLRNRAGTVVGEMLLHKGAVRDMRAYNLTLPYAFYQMLEDPQPGTFEFSRLPAESVPEGPAHNVMGLLMEGMRRYDELQRARVLAPDHAFLRATGSRPTPPAHESDGGFIRDLWTRMKDGGTPRQCEAAMAADSYRIRNLLAHWLAEGAIAVREAGENAAP
ncbi:MAG TPA: DUF4388 domain-containing protein [Thermoanaerobaculia bacterium]|nr:DUF4388 domain-containing protein [Thermoanaerobaculia bacterium]